MTSRALSQEWIADGWMSCGDILMWSHVPSCKCVKVGGCKWRNCVGIGAYPAEPANHDADGYVVGWSEHDPMSGEPCGEWQLVWVESYGTALKLAVECRKRILAEGDPAPASTQRTFDDLLRGAP